MGGLGRLPSILAKPYSQPRLSSTTFAHQNYFCISISARVDDSCHSGKSRHVPDSHRQVARRREGRSTFSGQCHVVDELIMTVEHAKALSRSRVPDPDGPISRAGNDEPTVECGGNTIYLSSVPL